MKFGFGTQLNKCGNHIVAPALPLAPVVSQSPAGANFLLGMKNINPVAFHESPPSPVVSWPPVGALLAFDIKNGVYWAKGYGTITLNEALVYNGLSGEFSPASNIVPGIGLRVQGLNGNPWNANPALAHPLNALLVNGFTAVITTMINPDSASRNTALLKPTYMSSTGIAPSVQVYSGDNGYGPLAGVYTTDANFSRVSSAWPDSVTLPKKLAFSTNSDGSQIAISVNGAAATVASGKGVSGLNLFSLQTLAWSNNEITQESPSVVVEMLVIYPFENPTALASLTAL